MKVDDPIHREISILDKDMQDLIKTKAFMRLANIKQQGNTYYLHPHANHTRYEHSLGVYEMFRKVVNSLVKRNYLILSEYEMRVGMIAALLHDIGHGPYSHCFQQISGQDHGEWFLRIIKEDEEIKSILLRTPNLIDDVISILDGQERFQIIEEILFGSLSVDQLDFWNRDLYHSSINIDQMNLDNLIHSLKIVDRKLVIGLEGIKEIEQMIKIKRALYNEGFGHPFVIG
ncbi:HD domain-containing protein [Pontibacillus sp. HMF3514]|uniref:HD domain-containing protein n=1 Tax=Pontibacillus sp. HMF3514 TaxID=2692425 RepID=UPI00132024CC|nr:HD domain-containing protein [Pontibacillus sp. HMF3514]QHE52826.1 HD domain-containing protein [Pontibacillus sp. HMF3514]